jgi:ABC-type bacteriocin/lantibiotic exporter with double-glycine peptidase domain
MELVKEIQYPAVEQGSSLLDLESALKKRGVYCRPLRVGSPDALNGEEPYILHLKQGHFVVFEGWVEGRAKVWDGSSSSKLYSKSALRKQMSGAVLETAQHPNLTPAARQSNWPLGELTSSALCILAGLGVFGAGKRLFAKSRISGVECQRPTNT